MKFVTNLVTYPPDKLGGIWCFDFANTFS
jgi:hypothetical protein